MKIVQTLKLEMTNEEKKAIETLYRMFHNLDWDEERIVADELGYCNLESIKTDLTTLYELSGEDESNLR